MHGDGRVRQLVVKIFVHETGGMCEIVLEIVSVHIVVMHVHTTILMFRLEIETNVVPVSWPDFIVGVDSVTEVFGDWHGEGSSLKQSHLFFKIFVFARVIVLVSVHDTNAGCTHKMVRVRKGLLHAERRKYGPVLTHSKFLLL